MSPLLFALNVVEWAKNRHAACGNHPFLSIIHDVSIKTSSKNDARRIARVAMTGN
ncbi:hypothetical protein ACFSUM_16755 [Virgibacillus siamensis]|uniref:hypothetical protein n=1 Tax=Virgibacillus siamensis TaxID=480071 RepID=UPI00363E236D